MYAVSYNSSAINPILHERNNVSSMIIFEVLLQICNLQIDHKLIQPLSKTDHIKW